MDFDLLTGGRAVFLDCRSWSEMLSSDTWGQYLTGPRTTSSKALYVVVTQADVFHHLTEP
jgi:hypothetical protein